MNKTTVVLANILLALQFYSHAESVKPFDWSTVLNTPHGLDTTVKRSGNQILHFKPDNKPCEKDPNMFAFALATFGNAIAQESDADVLKYASDAVTIDGAFIELGVCTGKTINFIAALNPLKTIYGFDSFTGLPEEWTRKDGSSMAQGTFGFKDPSALPSVLHNVELIKGLFTDTLPIFVAEVLKDTPIAFLHVDSDLYSSAATALTIFKKNIVEGSIIVFDEFYNYPGFEEHEFKALNEFLDATNFFVEYIAFNHCHEQAAVRICNKA